MISCVVFRIAESVDRYRSAREALIALECHVGEVGWEVMLPILADTDVWQLGQGRVGESAGTTTMSWIWLSRGIEEVGEGTSTEVVQDSKSCFLYGHSRLTHIPVLHIEWCKARARSMRWWEEVLLLLEEMRRVMAYHAWHANWWEDLAFAKSDLSPPNEEGHTAYAFRQAGIHLAMHSNCEHLWRNMIPYVDGEINVI